MEAISFAAWNARATPPEVAALVTTLDTIAIAINDWMVERREECKRREAKYEQMREASIGRRDEERWCYGTEMMQRDDAQLLQPIRDLMKAADKALAPFESALAAKEAK